jgi:hypothetical protein
MTSTARLSGLVLLLAVAACSESPKQYTTPVLGDDAFQATRTAMAVTGDVLANDSDPQGSPLTVVSWTQGAKGSVTYNGDGTFSWTPDPALASGTDSFDYTVQNAGGDASTATVTLQIAAGWAVTEDLGTFSGSASVKDPAGRITVVWLVANGTRTELRASSRDPVTGVWSASQVVDGGGAGDARSPVLTATSSGVLLATWLQGHATPAAHDDLRAARMAVDGTWEAAADVDSEHLGSVASPVVVAEPSSDRFTVAWQQSDGTRTNLWSARMSADGSWTTPIKIESSDYSGQEISLVVDGAGNATAVWRSKDPTYWNVYANRRTAGSWEAAATEIDGSPTLDAWSQKVFVDGQGSVTAMFVRNGLNAPQMCWRRYTGTGWSATTNCAAASSGMNGFAAVADSEGFTTLVWSESNGTLYNLKFTRIGPTGSAVSVSGTLESNDAGDMRTPSLVLDSANDVVAVWTQYLTGTTGAVWGNRLRTADSTWETATQLQNDGATFVTATPLVAADGGGRVVAAWNGTKSTGGFAIRAIRLDAAGAWGALQVIEDDKNYLSMRLALDPDGTGVFGWSRCDNGAPFASAEVRLIRISPTEFLPAEAGGLTGPATLAGLHALGSGESLYLASHTADTALWSGDFR